jgi:hypothetical protein
MMAVDLDPDQDVGSRSGFIKCLAKKKRMEKFVKNLDINPGKLEASHEALKSFMVA